MLLFWVFLYKLRDKEHLKYNRWGYFKWNCFTNKQHADIPDFELFYAIFGI